MTNLRHDQIGLPSDATVERRDYQQRTISKAIRMFSGNHRNKSGSFDPPAKSVLIESPTGSGKTIMGLAVASHMQRVHGLSVGWSSMRRNLLGQVDRENRRWGFNVDLELISMFAKNPPSVDVLVSDEAHHDATWSMANLHAMIRPKHVLGLTATPFRTDRSRLCFDHVIRDADIRQLIRDGYLSRYHHFTIPKYTPTALAQHLINDIERWGKTIVFFHRREQCDQCHQILLSNGINSEVVTAETDRERQIAEFTEGRVEVLINMLILTEGFDCPTLKTVFCRPSGKCCTIQMAGRVFRTHPDLPYKQIVQCQETRHPFVKTACPVEQYVWAKDKWQSLKANSHIDAISDRARRMIARANVRLPPSVRSPRR